MTATARTAAFSRATEGERDFARRYLKLVENDWRPKTRGDCAGVPRPCPYVACNQHLYLDVKPNGNVQFNFPGCEPWEMPADFSCALDVADAGGSTLEQVSDGFSVVRERIRQIEAAALKKLRALAPELAAHLADRERRYSMLDLVEPGWDVGRAGARSINEGRAGSRADRARHRAQIEADEWANEVLVELRAGKSLAEAQAIANAEDESELESEAEETEDEDLDEEADDDDHDE